MVKHPSPPFVEQSFYLGRGRRPLEEAALAATAIGGRLTGEVEWRRGSASFAGIYDDPVESTRVDPDGLLEFIRDESITVIALGITGVVDRTAPEVLTLTSIADGAQESDAHPVAVFTDGRPFLTADGRRRTRSKSDEGQALGRRVYRSFTQMVASLRPLYAAITVEYPLDSPTTLDAFDNEYALRDFYVDNAILALSPELQTRVDGAYVEALSDGIYVSTARWFNPRKAAHPDPGAFSSHAAQLIASSARSIDAAAPL